MSVLEILRSARILAQDAADQATSWRLHYDNKSSGWSRAVVDMWRGREKFYTQLEGELMTLINAEQERTDLSEKHLDASKGN